MASGCGPGEASFTRKGEPGKKGQLAKPYEWGR